MFDDELDQYAPTPLFERYHKDLRSWKMDRSFLERFPDLAYDINLSYMGAEEEVMMGKNAMEAEVRLLEPNPSDSISTSSMRDLQGGNSYGIGEPQAELQPHGWVLEMFTDMPRSA